MSQRIPRKLSRVAVVEDYRKSAKLFVFLTSFEE